MDLKDFMDYLDKFVIKNSNYKKIGLISSIYRDTAREFAVMYRGNEKDLKESFVWLKRDLEKSILTI